MERIATRKNIDLLKKQIRFLESAKSQHPFKEEQIFFKTMLTAKNVELKRMLSQTLLSA